MSWLLSPNMLLAGGIVAAGVFLFAAGQQHEARKTEAAVVEVNKVIVGERARDEAELASEAKEADRTDAAVSAGLTQQCILTEATAKLLSEIR